jgi:hypothetical protein
MILFLTVKILPSYSQVKIHHHSDGGVISPMVLSFINYTSNPNNVSNKPRFSLFFHFGEYYDFDLNNNFGFFSGLTLLNVGFISKNENLNIEKRFRTYALGLPIAVKLGSFKDDYYVYFGGEYQWFFHYKEKTYIAGDKIKNAEWFSNKTPAFMPSVFLGIQFPKDWTVKFQYQLNNFLRTENINDIVAYGIPNGQLFWISIAKTNFQKYLKKSKSISTQNAIYTINE